MFPCRWILTVALAVQLVSGWLGAQDTPPPPATGRSATWGSAQRTIRYDYRVMNPSTNAAGRIDIFVPLPLESPRQEIHYLHLPQTHQARLFTDVHGQKLAHYSFDSLPAGQWVDLGFVVGLTLSNMRWNIADPTLSQDAPKLTPEERDRYLKPELNYSMDTELMRQTAAELTRDATGDFDKLAAIHDYIISKIRYVRDDQWDPAAVVLTRGTGSCSEYNYVLSGLCRLAGLPTRCVGGTSSGFRSLPTTDTVFHRWTEVFLSGYGWFPADCSRDANPIRGKRSHFGRVYTDALVWCRQAGGEEDTLGWDYRARMRVQGDDPGLRENHRTRWFVYHPEDQVNAAYAWFSGEAAPVPESDLLECALLHWEKASLDNRLKMIRALAASGRNACLRQAAGLPEADGLRQTCLRELCDSPELANTILEKSRHLFGFRTWFRNNESKLVPTKDGRFTLAGQSTARKETPSTTASSSTIWSDLAADLVNQLRESLDLAPDKTIVMMPVVDQTLAGLGDQQTALHSNLKDLLVRAVDTKLIDEVRFDRLMAEQGPGRGEYWALANGDRGAFPPAMVPDIILVPVAITERSDSEKGTVLYHLEFKALELSSCKYTSLTARANRRPDQTAQSDRAMLVAGGDTMLARWEHDLVARHSSDWPLAGVQSVLSTADAALCNLECCVSLRGTPIDKGERCPFYYRARPEMLGCLTRAGIDIVTAANNHGGDYGPLSVADTAKWCAQAGLVSVGIGGDPATAEQPRLVRIGPVRVGIAGLDTTIPQFCATEFHPGTSYTGEQPDFEMFRDKVRRLGRWAEGRCDLLVLTIHWGANWVRETQPAHRTMARIALENGIDLILGHSAHRLQGIEIIDGKPVLYDMGNLLFDCELQPAGQQSALFQLHLSPRGVHKIEIIPTEALLGRTVLARHDEAQHILTEMRDLCASLGTGLTLDDDVEGRPMGVISIPEPKVTHRPEPDSTLPFATFPSDGEEIMPAIPEGVFMSALPEGVGRLSPPAELAPGVELLAARLPEHAAEGGILNLSTWWRVNAPIDRHWMLAFRLTVTGETPRRGTPWYTRHDPGDWAVPLSLLQPDQMVEDNYPARLAGLPAGRCEVHAMVIDTSRVEESRILGKQYLLGQVEIKPRVLQPSSD